MQFDVLGPLRVRRNGQVLPISGSLRRGMLAELLARANSHVSPDALIETMWGEQPDGHAEQKLQMHVHRLRQSLQEPDRLRFGPGGYSLHTQPEELDAQEFETLCAEAREVTHTDPQQAVKTLRKALALWRGEAFEGFDTPEIRAQAHRLHDLRLVALEQLYATELECGRCELVSHELLSLVTEHPLREKFHELLVMSHALAGRQADALAAYRKARSVLVDELGIEPGARLRELEIQILAGESVEPARPAPKTSQAPAQLPARPGSFVGRDDEQSRLDALRAGADCSATVAAVTGGAGVGKTAMVLHWAHQVRAEFPDGQLFMDLRGYGPEGPIDPGLVLARFLRALGVEPHQIPDDADERAALFRSEAAHRRLLVVLDNARDAQQVRPLLPGAPTSTVVVTSREALTGLVVQEGAQQISLSRMSQDEATALVTQLLDVPQLPEGAAELMELCAHLPLALRIAVERVRALGAQGLGGLVADLRDDSSRLDLLDAGDNRSSVRGVFLWSYHELDDDAAWLLRCMGSSPTRGMDPSALAAMAGLRPRAVRRGVEALRRAHLVEQVSHNRFHLHDLLRSFARELSEETDGEDKLSQAFSGLCDYYLRTSAAALEQVSPEEMVSPAARGILDDDELRRPFANSEEASHWLDTECENLVMLAERALGEGPHSFIATASKLLHRYLDDKLHDGHAQRMYSAALTAARCCGAPQDEADALRAFGLLAIRQDRFSDAVADLHAALTLDEQAGQRKQVANDHNLLGGAYLHAGFLPAAIEHCEKAIAEFRALEDPAISYVMGNFGFLHYRLGNLQEALKWLEISLKHSREHGKRLSECSAWQHLVSVHRDLGDYDRALECAERGLELAEELGTELKKAMTLNEAGRVHQRRSDHVKAREFHVEALSIANASGDDGVTADAHNGLADSAREAGDLAAARHHHQTALGLSQEIWEERSDALIGLGETYSQLGDVANAIDHWRQALAIYEEVGHSRVTLLRDMIQAAEANGESTSSPSQTDGVYGRSL